MISREPKDCSLNGPKRQFVLGYQNVEVRKTTSLLKGMCRLEIWLKGTYGMKFSNQGGNLQDNLSWWTIPQVLQKLWNHKKLLWDLIFYTKGVTPSLQGNHLNIEKTLKVILGWVYGTIINANCPHPKLKLNCDLSCSINKE
jgi:hypothetical protein